MHTYWLICWDHGEENNPTVTEHETLQEAIDCAPNDARPWKIILGTMISGAGEVPNA